MRRGLERSATMLVVALVLALSLVGTALAASRWKDMSDQQWIDDYAVTSAQAATVADGYPDDTFRPYQSVTRGQFAKMAVSGLGLDTYDPAVASFTDVSRGSTFYIYIEGAVLAQVVSGYPDATFRPTDSISRQQANSMMGRHLSQAELAAQGAILGNVQIGGQRVRYSSLAAWYLGEGDFYLAPYLDSTLVDVVHRPATAYLIYHHVVAGSNQYLSPGNTLTRAQAVAMVLRTLDAVGDVTETTPPAAPTDVTTTPTSPSPSARPIISGKTTVLSGAVQVYDTFGGNTTELVSDIADASTGDFIVQVPNNKALAEGLHSLTAKVTDSRGLISAASAAVAYRVDSTPPEVAVTAPLNSSAFKTLKPTFAADVTDAGSGVSTVAFQYAVDATTPVFLDVSTSTQAPYEAVWPGLGLPADGRYQLRVVATDGAGNQTVTPSTVVTLDRLAPDVAIDEIEHWPIAGSVYFTDDASPVFVATASDPEPAAGVPSSGVAHVDFYYALKSAVAADPSTTAGFTLVSSNPGPGYSAAWGSDLANGDYVFATQAVDRAGNTSGLVHQEVVVDDAAPVVNIITPAAAQVIPGGSPFNITWTATDVYFAPNPVKIEFTADYGVVDFATLSGAGGLAGDATTYAWAVPAQDASNCAIRITAVDAMGRSTTSVRQFSIAPAPPTGVAASDTDLVAPGIDGRDFHLAWTPSLSSGVTSQDIYILKSGTALLLSGSSAHASVASLGKTATSWTGDATITLDSAGLAFDAQSAYELYVVAVDGAGHRTAAATTWPVVAPAAPTAVSASDPGTVDGVVNGLDFSAAWTVSSSLDVIHQDIYVLPQGTDLTLATHQVFDSIANRTTASWTGPSSRTTDSAGAALVAGTYSVWIVAVSDDGRKTASAAATIVVVN